MAGDVNEQAMLSPDVDAKLPPRMRLGEFGTTGLSVIDKMITEESDKAWRMPNRIKTVDDMSKDEYIAAALQFYTVMLSRVGYKIKAPKNATPTQKERASFIQTCFDDMEDSWFTAMGNILTNIPYGFSVLEISLKRCNKQNSKYDDGLVRVANLCPRSQSTISGWRFSEDGRKLVTIEQSLTNIQYGIRYSNLTTNGTNKIEIPAEKCLIFSTSKKNGNPEGTPILKNAYKAWRYKKSVEQQEMLGLGRDLGGLVKMKAPAQYFSENASVSEKAIYSDLQKSLRNIARGEQEGVLIPSNLDPETKGEMFDLQLLTSQGSRGYDTNQIISRWNSAIMVSMFTDILNIGNGSTGSFALVEGKIGLVEYGLQYRLQEIADVINSNLIPMLFQYNQWSDSELPKMEFDKVSENDLDTMSKFVQRCAATNSLEKDREVLNIIRVAMGATPYPDDEPPHEEYFSAGQSRSGDGLTSAGEGTSKSPSGSDTSVSNNENV